MKWQRKIGFEIKDCRIKDFIFFVCLWKMLWNHFCIWPYVDFVQDDLLYSQNKIFPKFLINNCSISHKTKRLSYKNQIESSNGLLVYVVFWIGVLFKWFATNSLFNQYTSSSMLDEQINLIKRTQCTNNFF